jgi:cytidylate kinase
MLENQIDISNPDAVKAACTDITIDIQYSDGTQYVYLNKKNVNDFIRTETVSQMASRISAIPVIREKLLSLQRSLASVSDVIMDGRDIGTHVLPNADVKIYLTAKPGIRALRRYNELLAKGEKCRLEDIEKDIIERDNRDMNRAVAPLKQAPDAVLVDTSDMSVDEVIDCLHQLIAKNL